MTKITIDMDDVKDETLVGEMLDLLNKARQRAVKHTALGKYPLEGSACEIPNKDEKDPAKKLAEEQKYILCRFQSIQKLLFDLQNDLSRIAHHHTALYLRDNMRLLKTAEEKYTMDSRHQLSSIVNDRFHKEGPIGESRIAG